MKKLALLILFVTSICDARVFSLEKETIAPYIKATYGTSSIAKTHFEDTAGTGVSISESVSANLGGEFGVIFSAPKIVFKLGVEVIKPADLKEVSGNDISGTSMYTMTSGIQGIIPKAGLDIAFRTTSNSRTFVALGGGAGTVTYKNSYTLTAAGQTAFPGIVDYSEEGSGTATLMEGSFNYEVLMNDTTTVTFELGYRSFSITSYKYKEAVTTIDGTTHAKNDSVLNFDGSAKASNLSGPFVGLAFRIYLGK